MTIASRTTENRHVCRAEQGPPGSHPARFEEGNAIIEILLKALKGNKCRCRRQARNACFAPEDLLSSGHHSEYSIPNPLPYITHCTLPYPSSVLLGTKRFTVSTSQHQHQHQHRLPFLVFKGRSYWT